MGRLTLGKVGDRSGDPRGGLGRFEGIPGRSGRSSTVRWTLREVQDGSEVPRGGSGWFVRLSGRSGMSRRTLGEVRAGWGDHRGG